MVQITELREGNLVMWNPKLAHPQTTIPAMEVEVRSIINNQVEYVFPNIEHRVEPFEDDVVQNGTRLKPVEELEPIALTSEVLQRAGFEAAGKNRWLGKDGKFKIDNGSVEYDGNAPDERIENLHQLQNVYYKLTGEELEIDHS